MTRNTPLIFVATIGCLLTTAVVGAQPIPPFDAPTLQDGAHSLHLNPASLVFLHGTHGAVSVSGYADSDRVDGEVAFAGGFGRIFGGGLAVTALDGSMSATSGLSFGTEHFGIGVASERFFSKQHEAIDGVRTRTVGIAFRPLGSLGVGISIDGLTSDRIVGEPIRTHYRPGVALRTNNGRLEWDISASIPQDREYADIAAAIRARPTDGLRLFMNATARANGRATLERVYGGVEISFGSSSASFAAGRFGSTSRTGYVATAEFHSPGVPTFRRRVVLRVDLAGDLPESSPFALGRRAPNFVDIIHSIRTAAHDDRFDGLYLNMGGLTAGTAQLYELREAIREVQEAGKQVIAFFDSATVRDLYVAGGADVRLAAPTVSVLNTGIGITRTYFGDLLEGLGVNAQFVRIAEYKSGPERFTNDGPSPESTEQIDVLLDDIWGVLIAGVAENFALSVEEANALLDDGPLFAAELAEAGLLDEVLYRDELPERIEELAGRQIHLTTSASPDERDPYWHIPNRIAVLHIDGAIILGDSGDGVFGSQAGSDTIVATCRALAADSSIDGVLVRIDSPGGSALASERMHRALFNLAESKPVVVSMGDVAASGGMYVATFGSPIFATPNSVTGSIGIYAGTLGLDGLLDAIGINRVRDERGGESSLFDGRSWDEDTERAVREHIENSYQMFLERVADSRQMSTEEVDEIGRGRLWSGARAVDVGLVDSSEGLAAAFDALADQLDIDSSDRIELIHYPRARASLYALLPSLPAFRAATEHDLVSLLEAIGADVMLRWLAPWIGNSNGEPMAVTEWAFDGL